MTNTKTLVEKGSALLVDLLDWQLIVANSQANIHISKSDFFKNDGINERFILFQDSIYTAAESRSSNKSLKEIEGRKEEIFSGILKIEVLFNFMHFSLGQYMPAKFKGLMEIYGWIDEQTLVNIIGITAILYFEVLSENYPNLLKPGKYKLPEVSDGHLFDQIVEYIKTKQSKLPDVFKYRTVNADLHEEKLLEINDIEEKVAYLELVARPIYLELIDLSNYSLTKEITINKAMRIFFGNMGINERYNAWSKLYWSSIEDHFDLDVADVNNLELINKIIKENANQLNTLERIYNSYFFIFEDYNDIETDPVIRNKNKWIDAGEALHRISILFMILQKEIHKTYPDFEIERPKTEDWQPTEVYENDEYYREIVKQIYQQ